MSGWEATAAGWLLRSALGGGLILLLAWLWARGTKQPARQQRLGEWGLAAALLVAVVAILPGWLIVPLPFAPTPMATTTGAEGIAVAEPGQPSEEALAVLAWLLTWPERELVVPPEPESAAAATIPYTSDTGLSVNGPALLQGLPGWLALAYFAIVAVLLARWLLGHLALWRLLSQTQHASSDVVRLFQEMTPGGRRPRLLVSDRWPTPMSCGLLRPTIVLPRSLCDNREALLWVFAHEWAHLKRRDLWTCWLFSLGEVVFFYLPWFWWLRREVRLSQEYLADAAVLDQVEAPADYAQFLINMCTSPMLPMGATGVSGRPSELFRRVRMMLQRPGPLERRCPGFWSCCVAGLLVGLALLAGGVRLTAQSEEPTEPQESTIPEPPVSAPVVEDKKPEPAQQTAKPASEPLNPLGAFARRDDNPLGLRLEKLEPVLVEQLGLPKGTGLVFIEVTLPQSSAVLIGLKRHDVVLSIGGIAVPAEPRDLAKVTRQLPEGKALEVHVIRKGQPLTLSGLILVPKTPRPGSVASIASLPGSRFNFGTGPGVTTVLSHQGNQFQARQTEGSLNVMVTGTLVDGKPRKVATVIQDGAAWQVFPDIDQLSEPYRERVQRLLEMVERGAKSP